MIITETFVDLSQVIENLYGQKLTFKYVDASTAIASMQRKAMGINVGLKVKLTVEKAQDNIVVLNYNAGKCVAFVVRKAMTWILTRHPELDKALTLIGDKIIINLSKIKKTQKLVEVYKLESITFWEEGLQVSMQPA